MQKLLIVLLFALSVASFIMGVYSFIKQLTKNKGKSATQKLYVPTVFLFISIFSIRYSVGFYSIITNHQEFLGNNNLNLAEELINSLFHTLQTFSLDAQFTDSIIIGKELYINEFGSVFFSEVYGFYTSLLYICAPVIGGAILLGILTSAFPRLSLWLKPFREKYVFSELNEKAVFLAEDIIREAMKNRKGLFVKLPVILFTDTYVDKDDESSSELLQRAKELGAICIQDDILKLRFDHTKKLYYFLLDEVDINNMHTLTALTSEEYKRWNLKGQTYIYIFSQNYEISSIVKKSYTKDKEQLSNVVIKVVQEYTSIIYNLFNDVPLYYPLLTKYPFGFSGEKEFVLTIIGSEHIAVEAFLGAYWCGQMLDCVLKINVITEDIEKFKAKINHINPEILQSGLVDGNTNRKLLRIYPNQEIYASPYAIFSFSNANIEKGELFDFLYKKDDTDSSMLFSDYFVISLDSDELNITMAAEISRIINKESMNASICRRPVVAYSVFDSNIKDVVNSYSAKNDGVYLYAFAAFIDIYSCKNIFMKHITESAFNISKVHSKADMDKFLKDEYNWWSSIARVLHRKYKIYSLGLLGQREDPKVITPDETSKYWEIAGSLDADDTTQCERLTWLEHRRWNAFLRTKGFTAPTPEQWQQYAYKDPKNGITHKHIDLKLHPCIVECSDKIIIKDADWDDPSYTENIKLDYLDIVSIMVYQKQKSLFETEDKNDYKIWDKPQYDEE